MDILLKESNEIYKSQLFGNETLGLQAIDDYCTTDHDYSRATGVGAVKKKQTHAHPGSMSQYPYFITKATPDFRSRLCWIS